MSKKETKDRIWEIDFARGVAILCVMIVHAFVDLDKFSSVEIVWLPVFRMIKQYGGVFFVLLSGVSAYFSSKSVKRGTIVFLIGCCFTALTEWLRISGRETEVIVSIRWGVLHLIGFCMIVYPLIKNVKPLPLFIFGAIIIVYGYYIHTIRYDVEWLFMFGYRNPEWGAFDYFPILPHLGWFMVGNGLAKIIYRHRLSLFPYADTESAFIKLFMWMGRNSLQLYVIHQILFYIIAKQI